MKTATKSLSNQVDILQALLVEKESEIKNLQEKNQYLLEQFRLAQHHRFGKSSEASSTQGELFNEAEQLIDEETEAQSQDETRTSEPRKKPKRKPLPKDLPRETIIVDLSDDEKSCNCCGNDLHQMGEKKSEQLNRFLLLQNRHTVHPCT